MPVRDPSLGQIVRRQFHIHAITHQDANTVTPHSSRDRCEDDVLAVVDLHLKKSIRLFVNYDASQFD